MAKDNGQSLDALLLEAGVDLGETTSSLGETTPPPGETTPPPDEAPDPHAPIQQVEPPEVIPPEDAEEVYGSGSSTDAPLGSGVDRVGTGSGVPSQSVLDESVRIRQTPRAVNPIADNLDFLRTLNIDTTLPSPRITIAGSEIHHPMSWTGGRAPGRQVAETDAMTDPPIRGDVDYRSEVFTPIRKSLAAQQAEMRQLHQVASALRRKLDANQSLMDRGIEFSTTGQRAVMPSDHVEQAEALLQSIDARRRQLAPELRTAVNDFRNTAQKVMEIRELYQHDPALSPKRREELQRRGLQNILREDYGIDNSSDLTGAQVIERFVNAALYRLPPEPPPVGPEGSSYKGSPRPLPPLPTREEVQNQLLGAAPASASGASGVPDGIPAGATRYGRDRATTGPYAGAVYWRGPDGQMYAVQEDQTSGTPVNNVDDKNLHLFRG